MIKCPDEMNFSNKEQLIT